MILILNYNQYLKLTRKIKRPQNIGDHIIKANNDVLFFDLRPICSNQKAGVIYSSYIFINSKLLSNKS